MIIRFNKSLRTLLITLAYHSFGVWDSPHCRSSAFHTSLSVKNCASSSVFDSATVVNIHCSRIWGSLPVSGFWVWRGILRDRQSICISSPAPNHLFGHWFIHLGWDAVCDNASSKIGVWSSHTVGTPNPVLAWLAVVLSAIPAGIRVPQVSL